MIKLKLPAKSDGKILLLNYKLVPCLFQKAEFAEKIPERSILATHFAITQIRIIFFYIGLVGI